jgi:hypothetical protein
MTPTITRSHRRLIPWAIVLVVAVPAAGCKRVERPITAADRTYCDQTARVSAARGTALYKDIYDACIRNLQHPERGGG